VFGLDRFEYESVQVWFRFGSFRVRVYIGSFRVRIGSVQFGSFRVRVYIGSIRFQVGSILDWVISGFGLSRINTTLGRFGSRSVEFWFRVEIGSGLSDVGSGLVSGRSDQFIWFGSVLPGLHSSI